MILSIVMPAFNAASHLVETLQSVEPLVDGNDVELILVDDGSSDRTCAEFAKWRAIRVGAHARILSQEHAGVSVARNRGVKASKGKYILFLDSDDKVSPLLVSTLEGVLASGSNPDIVCWGWDTLKADGRVERRYFDVHPPVPRQMSGEEALYRRCVDRSLRLWTASAAYRSEFLRSNGLQFTPGCAVGEDLEFSYMALLNAERVCFVPLVLSTYCRRTQSMTQTGTIVRFESISALQRVLAEMEADARPEVERIAQHFRRSKVLVNYFYTLESCLTITKQRGAGRLLAELDRRYPGLRAMVRAALISGRGYVPREWALYAVDPNLWWFWIRLRRGVDALLPPKLRSIGSAAHRRRSAELVRMGSGG